MAVPSWLTVCSTLMARKSSLSPENQDSPASSSTSGSSSDNPSSTETSLNSETSLQSIGSLDSLPSVASLQLHSTPQENLSPINFRLISSVELNSGAIQALHLAGKCLYTGTSGNQIQALDKHNLALVSTLGNPNPCGKHHGAVKSLAIDGDSLFIAFQDSKIRVFSLTSPKQKQITSLPTIKDCLIRFIWPQNYVQIRRHRKRLWISHADAVSAIAINPGFLYSVSWDKTLKIWRLSDYKCLESLKAHDDAINAVTVSKEGFIYTGSADKRIKVWTKRNGAKRHELVATLERHKSAINALALSSDGSVLYSGSGDRSILVWEREDSAQYMSVAGALRGHKRAILSLVVGSLDLTVGSVMVFSGSADRTVRVWRRGVDGRHICLAVLDGHHGPVRALVAGFQGGLDHGLGSWFVYSGCGRGEVRVWEVSGSNSEETELL
ncbi:hypothetical protein AMTRI_Chr06g200100 [Amborella trichopoda]